MTPESPTFIDEATAVKSPLLDVGMRTLALHQSLSCGFDWVLEDQNGEVKSCLFTLEREEIASGPKRISKLFRDLDMSEGVSIVLTSNGNLTGDFPAFLIEVKPPVNEAYFVSEQKRIQVEKDKGKGEEPTDGLFAVVHDIRPANVLFAYSGKPKKDDKVGKDNNMVLRIDADISVLSRRGNLDYPPRMFEADPRLIHLMTDLVDLFEQTTASRSQRLDNIVL